MSIVLKKINSLKLDNFDSFLFLCCSSVLTELVPSDIIMNDITTSGIPKIMKTQIIVYSNKRGVGISLLLSFDILVTVQELQLLCSNMLLLIHHYYNLHKSLYHLHQLLIL